MDKFLRLQGYQEALENIQKYYGKGLYKIKPKDLYKSKGNPMNVYKWSGVRGKKKKKI